MAPRTVHPFGVTLFVGLMLLGTGCSSAPPAGTGTLESPVQAATPVRDRGLELATLRGELAAARIAAAKKEAELIELRDLVRQLRIENAESRQAVLDLRDRADQRQRDLEQSRDVQDRQAHAHATHDLSVLKERVVTLAHDLAQLKEELSRSVTTEGAKPVASGSSKAPASGPQARRSDSLERMSSAHQHTSPSFGVSPTALSVTDMVVLGPPTTVTVQVGDTLASLATRHRTTVEVLRALNALNGDALIVGRELVIPAPQQP